MTRPGGGWCTRPCSVKRAARTIWRARAPPDPGVPFAVSRQQRVPHLLRTVCQSDGYMRAARARHAATIWTEASPNTASVPARLGRAHLRSQPLRPMILVILGRRPCPVNLRIWDRWCLIDRPDQEYLAISAESTRDT